MGSGFSLGTKDPPGVWVMLGGHRGPQVPVGHCGVHGLSPHQGCSHLSLRETPRWQQRCNRQEFRQKATNPQTQTNAKEEIPAYFLPFFFFFLLLLSRSSTSQSTLYFQLRHPRGSGFEGRAEPGAGELLCPSLGSGDAGRAGGRTPLTWAVPQVRAGISLLRSIPGGTADPAGNCVAAAAGLT